MRERQRLARDLHDAVSQALSSISLMSQSLVSAWRRDPAEGERRARRIEELSRLAFAEMRALLRELRPETPVDRTPTKASSAGVADVKADGARRGASALRCRARAVCAEHSPRLCGLPAASVELEEGIYLICREALSNAIRHAGASRVEVRAAVDADILTLTVQDDGRGFDGPTGRRIARAGHRAANHERTRRGARRRV